jgi:hypothetical protein
VANRHADGRGDWRDSGSAHARTLRRRGFLAVSPM